MASIDAQLAWSVPVQVDRLAAHLDAYINLCTTIDTLRLCQRFGRGDDVSITKLPPELIEQIGGLLMDEERSRLMPTWREKFLCFRGLCRPTDHMSPSDIVQLHEDHLGPGSTRRIDVRKMLSEASLHDLDETLRYGAHLTGDRWQELHERMALDWKKAVNDSDGESLLIGNNDLIKRHFGLQVFCTHTQARESEIRNQLRMHNILPTTIAYLTIPSPKFHYGYDRAATRREAGILCPLETDGGYGLPVAMPSALSKRDIAKFSRAVKILGLSVLKPSQGNQLNPARVLAASVPDANAYSKRTRRTLTSGSDVDPFVLKLRLLVRSTLQGDSWPDATWSDGEGGSESSDSL